jgi:asparagine synthase (glutamine-hydrolysing)
MAHVERAVRVGDLFAPRTLIERHVDWVTSNRAALRADVYGPRLDEAINSPAADDLSGVGVDREDVVGSLMRLDQQHWLPSDVLTKADRASMGASLELRTPFLSLGLAEFAATVPSAVHLRGGGKFLLRKVLERALPSVGGGRRKVAFRVPRTEWLRGPLAPVLTAQLEGSPLYSDGWFDRETVRAWAKDHAERRSDLSAALWPLVVLGCWFSGNIR